jgi:hypothetical protein
VAAATLLRTAGIADTRDIVTAYGAVAVLQMDDVLPACARATCDPRRRRDQPQPETAAYLGAAVLVTLLAVGTALFVSDAPLELTGRAVQWLVNATV